MKKSSLLLTLLLALTFAISSCKKDDDPAPNPIVGAWELDKLEISDMPAPYTSLNGAGFDNYLSYSFKSRIEIKNDKTFNEIYKNDGLVFEFDGTWTLTNNQLSLDYTDPDIDDVSYTFDPVKMRLYGAKSSVQDTFKNPTTDQDELVSFSVREVFIKD